MAWNDLRNAYRGIPTVPSQLGACVIALPVLDEHGVATMMFAIVWGHPYGLKSAVNNFNMWPEAIVAVCRRIYGTCIWHYFDDFGLLIPDRYGSDPQDAFRELMTCLGRQLHEEKSGPPEKM